MQYQFTPIFFLQSLPSLFALMFILVLWRRRHVEGVIYLIFFECSTALWSVADGLEHASTILSLKIFWSQFAIFGASTIPPLFLLFTLAYFRNEKFPMHRIISLLFLIPIITITLSTTNQYHHLVWRKIEIISDNSSTYYYGKWFWLYVFYEFFIALMAILVLLTNTIRFYKIYKNQIVYLILASILPFTACIIYVFKLTSLNADLTPLSLTIVGVFIILGIYHQGMLDILPIARKQIISYLDDGVIVIDMANRVVDANSGFSLIIGIPQEQIIGKTFEMINKEFIPKDFYQLSERATTEAAHTINNETRLFEITFNPVKANKQKLIGKIFILHDITKRRNALDSAMKSNKMLRQEIAEKEKLIIDLDAYARSVAHDLKNPISGLLGLRDLIREDLQNGKKDEALELIEIVHEQGLKMYKIVDDLLLMSRIRKEDFDPIPIDMVHILNEALKRLNGIVSRNDIKIEAPNSWPSVLGHPQWIEEVWYNLISNAYKYGGNPPVIKLGYSKIDGSKYHFWIQDNGDGLGHESIQKLFSDFERLGCDNKEGHGLGLSIVKRIVEKLGGEVSVISENIQGQGCIFGFTLKAKLN
jgi:PAS domain S-box-containing protein